MNKWDGRFLDLAYTIASWSKDPKRQCGCVVVEPDTLKVAGLGFNGFPRGMCDHKDLYANGEIKLNRVLHAEENAILNASKTDGCTAYVTSPPCAHCALMLIQSGIDRVVFTARALNAPPSKWEEEWKLAESFFAEAEVKYDGLAYG